MFATPREVGIPVESKVYETLLLASEPESIMHSHFKLFIFYVWPMIIQ